MKASVIISTFNNLEDLGLLMPSLERQSLDRHEMEIILRDDGSQDGTCAWIKTHCPGVQLISGDNVGFSRSNNIAARRATGEALVFVNADTVLDPCFIAAGLNVLERNPQVGGVNCNMIMPWIMDLQAFLDGGRPASGYGFFLNRFGFIDYRDVGLDIRPVLFLSGGGCFVRRIALEVEAPFAEDLLGGTAYCEDLDLSLRLLARGWRLRFAPAAVLYHNQRAIKAVGLPQLLKFIRVSVNRVTVYAINLSLPCFLRFLPALFRGVLQKVKHLPLPEKIRKRAIAAGALTLPLLILLLPYWIYRNVRSGAVRASLADLSILKGVS